VGVCVRAFLGRYRARNGPGRWLVGLVRELVLLFCPFWRNWVSPGWRAVFYLGYTISTSFLLWYTTSIVSGKAVARARPRG